MGAVVGDMPYLTLPSDINLSRLDVQAAHPDVQLTLDGRTYHPEPLVFYAATLLSAGNPKGAIAFVEWLQGNAAQSLFQRAHYDPPGDAPPILA